MRKVFFLSMTLMFGLGVPHSAWGAEPEEVSVNFNWDELSGMPSLTRGSANEIKNLPPDGEYTYSNENQQVTFRFEKGTSSTELQYKYTYNKNAPQSSYSFMVFYYGNKMTITAHDGYKLTSFLFDSGNKVNKDGAAVSVDCGGVGEVVWVSDDIAGTKYWYQKWICPEGAESVEFTFINGRSPNYIWMHDKYNLSGTTDAQLSKLGNEFTLLAPAGSGSEEPVTPPVDLSDLGKLYQQVLTDLTGMNVGAPYDDVYGTYQSIKQKRATELYKETDSLKNVVEKLTVDLTTPNLSEADKQKIQAEIDNNNEVIKQNSIELAAIGTNAKQFAIDQNAAFQAAMDAYKEDPGNTVPEALTTVFGLTEDAFAQYTTAAAECNAAYKKVNDSILALHDKIVADFYEKSGDAELMGTYSDEFKDEIAAVAAAKTALEAKITEWTPAINAGKEAQATLDAFGKDVDPTFKDWITSKVTVPAAEIDPEKETSFTAVKTKYQTYEGNLATAKAAANATKCENECKIVNSNIEGYVTTELPKNLKTFESKYSNSNKTYVENQLTALAKAIPVKLTDKDPEPEKYKGYDVIEQAYNNLKDRLTTIKNSLNSLSAAAALFSQEYVDEYNTIDNDLKTLLTDIENEKATVENYKNLLIGYTNLEIVVLGNDENPGLVQYNKDNSLEPATSHFATIIEEIIGNSEITEVPETLDNFYAIKLALETALENVDLSTPEQMEVINTAITALTERISNIKSDIIANEATHNAQLAQLDAAYKYLNKAINSMETRLGNISDPEEQADVQAAIDELYDLRDKSLPIINTASFNNYADGNAAAGTVSVTIADDGKVTVTPDGDSKVSIENAYKHVTDRAEDVMKAFWGDIENINNTTLERYISFNADGEKTTGWDKMLTRLQKKYTDAITDYNKYWGLPSNSVAQQTFKTEMTDSVSNHSGIFEYVKKIRELEGKVKTWVLQQNSDSIIFSQANFNEKWVNAYTDKPDSLTYLNIFNGMAEKVETMQTEALKLATDYYNAAYLSAKTKFDAAVTALVNAFTTDTETFTEQQAKAKLASLQIYITDKPVQLPTDWKEAYKAAETVSKELGKLENITDAAINDCLNKIWKADIYNKAAEITKLQSDLDQYQVELGENVDLSKAKTQLAGILEKAEILNTEATTDVALVTELPGYAARYRQYVADAQEIFDNAKARYDAYKEYYDVTMPELNKGLEGLNQYAQGLASDNSEYLENASDAIIALADYVGENVDDLDSVKDTLTVKKDNAEQAIEKAYFDIANHEQSVLADFIEKVKVSYNNAKVLSKTLTNDELVKYNEQIEAAAAKAQTNFDDWAGSTEKAALDTYKKTAVALEAELSTIYVALENSYEGSKVGQINKAKIESQLNKQYDDVAKAIKETADYLADCEESVKTAYAAKVEGFTTDLNAEKAAWTADGDRVVMTYKNYEAAMTDLAAKVDAKKAEIEAAQAVAKAAAEKAQANAEAYDRLSKQLAGYQAQYEALAAKANEYEVTDYVNLSWLSYYIASAKSDLDAAYDNGNGSLNAESVIANAANIESQIRSLTYYISKTYADRKIADANSLVSSTNTALAGNIVPEDKVTLQNTLSGYNNALTTQKGNLSDAVNAYIAADKTQENAETAASAFKNVADAVDQIIADINALAASIDQYRFTPGDVNGNPDGEVTVADVQMIINWVGNPASQADMTPAQRAAADLTKDGVLDIADVTAVINLVLNQNAPAEKMRMTAPRATAHSTSSMSVLGISSEDDMTTYAIMMNNAETFVAGQFDINVAEGVEIVDIRLADRTAMHDLYRFDNESGARVIIASMENAAMTGNDGAVVFVRVKGQGNISLDNAYFAEGNAAAVKLDTENHTTMLDSIIDGAKELNQKIYNVAGQAMRSIQRGINIIRNSDGTTSKELHK